jgi:hypothetical protein
MMKEMKLFYRKKQIPSDFFRKGDNVRGIESVELKASNYNVQNF